MSPPQNPSAHHRRQKCRRAGSNTLERCIFQCRRLTTCTAWLSSACVVFPHAIPIDHIEDWLLCRRPSTSADADPVDRVEVKDRRSRYRDRPQFRSFWLKGVKKSLTSRLSFARVQLQDRYRHNRARRYQHRIFHCQSRETRYRPSSAAGPVSPCQIPLSSASARCIPRRRLRQRVRVVRHHPPVIQADIARGCPSQIDLAVRKQQRRTWKFTQWIEIDLPSGTIGTALFTEALISTGPPNFSAPVVMANACNRWT